MLRKRFISKWPFEASSFIKSNILVEMQKLLTIFYVLWCSCGLGRNNEVDPNLYKISMVSSATRPNDPAKFSHALSPVWDEHQQMLFFVDSVEQNIYRLEYSTGKIQSKHISYGSPNVVALVYGSRRLLVGVRSSLFLMDWQVPGDKSLHLLNTLDIGEPDNVVSEGKADASGRFWAGTKGSQIGDDIVPDRGSIYSFDQMSISNPRVQIRPMSITGGIAWALNNSVIYFADSPSQKIEAFDFDIITAQLSGRRTVIDISLNGYDEAIPSGMTVDDSGDLWVALMYAGTVLHINPDTRQIIYAYKLPVSRTTAVCWGGPSLDDLFVTTAKDKSTDEPLAGALFTLIGTRRRGITANRLRFDSADTF